MVVLDLLDIGSSTPASASANSNGKLPTSGLPAGIVRGDVVFAKYGQRAGFYWAKVKKVYSSSGGEQFCDVQWLRPQAGAPVEKSYVLHDGYDETQHGDGLKLALHIRRPSAADLTAAAPPGAAASASSRAATAPKGNEMSDLLGELIVEKPAEPQPIFDSMMFSPPPAIGSSLPQPPSLHTNKLASAQVQPSPFPTNWGWQAPSTNVTGASPWASAWKPDAFSSASNVSVPRPAVSQQSSMMPHLQSTVKPGTAAAPINELQAAFVSDLLQKSPGDKVQALNINASRGSQEDKFDFIKEMMSGALVGTQSD